MVAIAVAIEAIPSLSSSIVDTLVVVVVAVVVGEAVKVVAGAVAATPYVKVDNIRHSMSPAIAKPSVELA